MTVSATDAWWVLAPSVPVIKIVEDPVEAGWAAFTVKVALPPAVNEDLDRLAETPFASPETVRLTVPAVPTAVVLMVTVDEPPLEIVRVGGLALIVKSLLVEAGLTVRLTGVVSVVPSEVVPVTVTENVPVVAVDVAVNVRTDVPLPLTGLVPNAAVTPEGRPEALRVTPELSVPLTVTVMVEVPWLPCVSVAPVAERLNVPCCVPPPVKASIKPALGLPHPVTRSKPVTAEKLPEVPLLMSWKSAA